MPKGFQDTYNNVNTNSDIDEDHKIIGTNVKENCYTGKLEPEIEFLDVLLIATYSRSGSIIECEQGLTATKFHFGCLLSGPKTTATSSTT